jgi:hypothetical protein
LVGCVLGEIGEIGEIKQPLSRAESAVSGQSPKHRVRQWRATEISPQSPLSPLNPSSRQKCPAPFVPGLHPVCAHLFCTSQGACFRTLRPRGPGGSAISHRPRKTGIATVLRAGNISWPCRARLTVAAFPFLGDDRGPRYIPQSRERAHVCPGIANAKTSIQTT